MRWPLRRQILLPMVGIVLVSMGLASALSAWLASAQVHSQLQQQLADVAQTLSASNFPLESNVLRQTRGLTGADYVLQDSAGRIVAATDDALRPAATNGSAAARFDLSRVVTAGGRSYLQAAVPIDRRRVGGGLHTLHVLYPAAAWRQARWQAVWPPLALGGAACVLVAAAAYVVASRVTRPIEKLHTQVERIALGDFAALPTPAGDDEVRDLAVAVNQLAVRLARYEAETRQSERLRTLGTLGGGIAHQIRNAATGCRIALDLHLRDCPQHRRPHAPSEEFISPSEMPTVGEEPLAVAVRQLELIETYVRKFLTLGRPAAKERAATDVAGVIRQALALVEPMARHSGLAIRFDPPQEATIIPADAESLGQMLVNLLVNAVQATAPSRVLVGGGVGECAPDCEGGGEILVRLDRPAQGRCRIAVGDPGPGPAASIQDRLFEPFATDKPGGTGLGLVVSRQIAEDHGGTIRWERRDGRTWFIVETGSER